MTIGFQIDWGNASPNARAALDAAAQPFQRILVAHGVGGAMEGPSEAASLIRTAAIHKVFVVERRVLPARQLRAELATIQATHSLALELAKRLRSLAAGERSALANDIWRSPSADFFPMVGHVMPAGGDAASLIQAIEAIAAGAATVEASEKERAKSRLPSDKRNTKSAVVGLARLWVAAHGEMPIRGEGPSRAGFVRLVEDWETEAGRAPGPQPRSIRLYLRNLAPNFAA